MKKGQVVARTRTSVDPIATLTRDVNDLKARVKTLEGGRPGRKSKPLIALRQDGVCAVDPERDSSKCPDASIYRYQNGCYGTECRRKQHDAYERRKGVKSTAVAVRPRGRKKPAEAVVPVTKPIKRATRVSKRITKRPPAQKRLAS